MRCYALCGEKRYRCGIYYFPFFDNNIRIVEYRLKDKEWRQINFINRFAFNERLLIFFIANMIMKLVF